MKKSNTDPMKGTPPFKGLIENVVHMVGTEEKNQEKARGTSSGSIGHVVSGSVKTKLRGGGERR